VSNGVDWEKLNGRGDFNYLNLNGSVPALMALDNDMGNAQFWTSLPINEGTQRTAHIRFNVV